MADKESKDEPQEVQEGHVPNLDQVNDLTQAKLEHENDEEEKEDDSADADKPDVDDSSKSDDKEVVVPEPDVEVPEPEEVDSEITKPGKDKVAIKAFDGKTFYFNNLDEVPDDFEPANYKTLMAGTKALMRKEDTDAKNEADAADKAEKAELKKRTDAMQESWDKDIKALKLENEAVEEVYDYMSAKLKDGVALDNFEQAYKAMSYDKMQEEQESNLNDRKKQRGAKVQGSTSSAGDKPKIISAPPRGVSLDQVHDKILRDLG